MSDTKQVQGMVERLEPRLLLASYSIADYFPMASGIQWSYAGSYWEDSPENNFSRSAQMIADSAHGTFNGQSGTVITDRIRPTGWSVDDEVSAAWYAMDSSGLYVIGGTAADQSFLYRQQLFPAVTTDGQFINLTPASFTTSNVEGLHGTVGGSVTVVGSENVTSTQGWSFNAVKMTYARTLEGNMVSEGVPVRFTENSTFTGWYARGVGLVKSSLEGTQTYYPEGYDPTVSRFGEAWTLSSTTALPNWLNFNAGVLSVFGTSGSDYISFTSEAGQVRARLGDDSVLLAGVTQINVYADDGDDAITMQGLMIPGNLYGQDGRDTIVGGEMSDLIYGGDGDDVIRAGGGQDTVYGNNGNDDIDGGTGADSLMGGLGNDTILGGQGPDRIFGGDGMDLIRGALGADYIEGRGKSDTIYGGEKDDTILGGAGSDYIIAGDGNDYINVGAHVLFSDTVYGGAGTDTALADADDVLFEIESVIF